MKLPNNWKDDCLQIWNHSGGRIILSIITGMIIAIIDFFLNEKKIDSNGLLISTIASILVYLGFIVKDTNELYKLRQRLGLADSSYKDLLDSHLGLPHKYPNFINDRLTKDYHTKKGLIFINVDNDDYRQWINECANHAESSFCATLTDNYLPSFFFIEDHSGKLTSKSIKNIQYLENTNELKVRQERIRILMSLSGNGRKSLAFRRSL